MSFKKDDVCIITDTKNHCFKLGSTVFINRVGKNFVDASDGTDRQTVRTYQLKKM